MFVYEPSGPHRVGTLDLLTDRGQSGVLARLYYPSSGQVGPGCPYMERQYVHGLLDFLRWGSWLRGFIGWASSRLRLGCAWRGDLIAATGDATAPAQLPLMVFSHGLGGQRQLYSAICMDLASHGFIVAAPEHRDGSASASFFLDGDSRRVWLPYQQHPLSDYSFRNRQLGLRVAEVMQLTDAMMRLHRGLPVANYLADSAGTDEFLGQFQGRIDTSRVHVMGHSFGAATALTVAVTAPEGLFKTCCLHDVWMHPVDPEHYGQMKLPLLVLNNQLFHWETNVHRVQSVLESPGLTPDMTTVLTIRGTNHSAQSDSGLYTSLWLSKRMGLIHAMEPREAIRLSSRISRLFVARHEGRKLKDDEEKLLNGDSATCFASFSYEPDTPRHN